MTVVLAILVLGAAADRPCELVVIPLRWGDHQFARLAAETEGAA
ncbi:hypothetical protein [Streptomyces lavendofoliae]|nr:hypothetical protein [Streptomyces lavendofoliae]